MTEQKHQSALQPKRPPWLSWRALPYFAGLTLSFFLGVMFAMTRTSAVNPKIINYGSKAAYLVASWDLLHPDHPDLLKPFVDAAVPLAKKAGFEPLAGSSPQVLEGVWPYKGVIIVQKYTSMRALQEFWNSREHAAAKKLREGLVDSHFVIAVEAD